MKVAMIDLLSQTPFYDRCLGEVVAPLVDQFTLYAPRFHHEPDYFKSANFTRAPALLDQLGLTFSRARLLRRPMRFIEYYLNWWALLRHFHSCSPDLVHIQWLPLLRAPAMFSEMRLVRYLRSRKIPIVYTMHNYLPHKNTPSVAVAYHKLYRSVDHLIVHTQTDRQRLLESGICEDKITVVPQGPVFSDQFGSSSTQAREALGIHEDEFVLLMLGVLRPYKGIEEAIRSLPYLVDRHPQIRLWLIGNVIDKKYIQHLHDLTVELELQQYLHWRIGYVPSNEMGRLHAAADVVLFPYRNISQSGAFLTAAALGKCTLSTPVGGIGEIVRDGENGVQIATAEPEAIAKGLRRCLNLTSEQRIAMGSALRHDVTQTCGWKRIAKQTVAVYENVRDRC